jgi:hypothetical protein
MPVVPHHRGTRADWRPDVGKGALLPDPGFVAEPNLDWFAGRRLRYGGGDYIGKAFLKSS